jgi:hypothetical protein
MARLLPTIAPPRPWYKLPRWGWVALLVVALVMTVANGWWRRGEMPVDGAYPRGPVLAVWGFPLPAVLGIDQREGLQGAAETVEHRSYVNKDPAYTYTGDIHFKPGAAQPATFADGSTSRVYDAWALGLDIGVGVAAPAATFALCAWLARRGAVPAAPPAARATVEKSKSDRKK